MEAKRLRVTVSAVLPEELFESTPRGCEHAETQAWRGPLYVPKAPCCGTTRTLTCCLQHAGVLSSNNSLHLCCDESAGGRTRLRARPIATGSSFCAEDIRLFSATFIQNSNRWLAPWRFDLGVVSPSHGGQSEFELDSAIQLEYRSKGTHLDDNHSRSRTINDR